jgi:hypothetical protein
MSNARAQDERPLLTLDFDGVICGPPLRVNLGIHRRFLDPRAEPPMARVPPRWLSLLVDRPRFALRRPLPGAREALARLARERRLVVLTGRRTSPARWLARHGLAGFVEAIRINDGGRASPHYKLAAIEELGAAEHIDDDPRTVQLLAERDACRVFLRDWPRNRDLPYAPGVTRVADLGALARLLVPRAARDGGAEEPGDATGGTP